MKHKIEVHVDGFGHGTVAVDGVDLSGAVCSIRFRSRTGDETQVVLTLSPDADCIVTAEAKVLLDRIGGEPVDDV